MIIDDVQQNSPEWLALRSGRPTSSCFDMIITPKTGKPSAQSQKYLYTLAGERIAGVKAESFQSDWMARGLQVQGEAIALFEMVRDVQVKEVGIVYPDERKLYSCSPDGLMETEGLEVKCPAMHTHVDYLLNGSLPDEYKPQIQGSLLITGFQAWWFMSYYPGLPPLIVRVERDEKFIATLKVLLEDFCKELDKIEAKLRGMI